MSGGAIVRPDVTDTRLAEARECFLTGEPIGPGRVRDTILASWRRSREWNVAAGHIDLLHVGDPNLDTPLTRNALPVLQNLRDNVQGQPLSVMLTDARGVLLYRLTADRDFGRHLDGVQLLPGFSYAEEFAGTNGIGTALESGRAAHVFGHEHYAEHLEDLACAAAPVRHPVSGKIVGVVDLTCWRKDANALLIALAYSTAGQITQALLNDSGAGEVQLLQEYLRACRHTGGIIFAINNDMVMMNHHARDVLDPGDQAVMLAHAAEALAIGHLGPGGCRAALRCPGADVLPARSREGPAAAGRRRRAREADRAGQQAGRRRQGRGRAGSCPAWSAPVRSGCAGAIRWMRPIAAGEWLALEGEPGTGKLALLRAVHRHRNPAGTLRVLDAAEAADRHWLAQALGELLEGQGSLVIQHVNRLSSRRLRSLWIALEQALAAGRQKTLWVAVTLSQSPVKADLARPAAVLPEHRRASAAAPPHRGPASAGAVLPGQAEPRCPAGLLARGDAASAAVQLAGQHQAALAGAQPGRAPQAQRDHPSS